jgi:hypothetical protein
MEKVLTWAQHSSSKGFNLDPNLQRWIEIVGPEWTHIAAKKTFHVSQSDWSLAINQSINQVDWLIDWKDQSLSKVPNRAHVFVFLFLRATHTWRKIHCQGRPFEQHMGRDFEILQFLRRNAFFLKKFWIYEVDLLQGRDILNVKSPVPTFLSFPKPF